MGATKDGIFSTATNEMANLLKAFGHPARFEIINLLRSEKTCCGTTIMSLIPLSQSTISKHLSELKNAEIISCVNKGNGTNYTLNEGVLKKIESYFTFDANKLDPDVSKNLNPVTSDNTPKIEKIKEIKSKKVRKINLQLKKENYIFKHLLIKSSTILKV